MANKEAWLKEYGKDATFRCDRVTNRFKERLGYLVVALCFYASPARIELHTFQFEVSAQEYIALLKKQYQPKRKKVA